MAGIVSIGVGATGVTSLTLDAGYLVDRVANLLRRSDLKNEILHWLNFAQWQMTRRVKFPELRTTAPVYAVSADDYDYALPADYAHMDSLFYKATARSPVVGWSLTPLPPRYFGEPVDIESRLNVDVASRFRGDPKHYLFRNKTFIVAPSPLEAGELYFTYYKLPPDMTTLSDSPAIDKRWRPELIWLAFYWAKSALEQEDATKPIAWERKAETVLKNLVREVNSVYAPREGYELPDVGLEEGDSIY